MAPHDTSVPDYLALLRQLAAHGERRTADIITIAVALSQKPLFTTELQDLLLQPRSRLDSALHAGVRHGIFAKETLAHNKHRWMLVGSRPAAPEPEEPTPSRRDEDAFAAGRRIRSFGGGHRAGSRHACSRFRDVPARPASWVPPAPPAAAHVAEMQASFSVSSKLPVRSFSAAPKLAADPLGTKGTTSEVDPRGRRILPFRGAAPPDPTTAARVLALADTWAAACRSAFGAVKWCSAFTSRTPWASTDPTQLRRWQAYLRLDERLRTWGADPGEFCVAITQHFAQWRQGARLRVPNPTQVSGDWGWKIWWRWHIARRGEAGLPTAPAQRAKLELASRQEQMVQAIAHAWKICRHQGVLPGLELQWRPEVLWLLRLVSPAARQVLANMLDGSVDPLAQKVRDGLARIDANTKLQRWLTTCLREALGAQIVPLSVLPSAPGARKAAS